MDGDDWMIAGGKFKNEPKSDVNSRLKSDPITDNDFNKKETVGVKRSENLAYVIYGWYLSREIPARPRGIARRPRSRSSH